MDIMPKNSENMLEFNKLINWYLNDDTLTNNDQYLDDLVSKNISSYFKLLKITPKKKLIRKMVKIPNYSMKIINKKDKDYAKIFKKLSNEVKKNKNYFFDFLIHGSFSTGDYIKGWSDLDTYVIIKNNVLADHNNLKKLKKFIIKIKKYLYEIDPIQHHGFIFCPQKYLKNYKSFMLPSKVLEKSKSLINERKLILFENINNNYPVNHLKSINNLLFNAYKNGFLEHHKYKNKYLLENYKDKKTMYQMKYFLSIVMTLPTYFLHSKGRPIYKKKSFEIVKKFFDSEWEIIDTATKIRFLWATKQKHPFRGNNIPLWLEEILGKNYFKRAYILSNKLIDN